MEKQNKFLVLGVIVLSIVVAFLGGYLINSYGDKFQMTNISSSINKFSNNDSGNTIKNKAELASKLSQISSSRVFSVAPVKSSKIRYLTTDGTVVEIDQDGLERIVVTKNNLKEFRSVSWAPDGKSFIYFDSTGPYLYDIENEQGYPLNKDIKSVAFSPNGNKIVYHFFNSDEGEGNISISNPDGSNYSVVLKTRLSSINLEWPNTNKISFQEKLSADKISALFGFNIMDKTLTSFVDNKIGLDVLWSSSGSRVLYSFFDEEGLNLAIKELDSEKTISLSQKTFASKCAWGIRDDTLYCAEPSTSPDKPIKPSYSNSPEYLTKQEISANKIMNLFKPSSFDPILIKNPFVSSLESSLYFINYLDGRLYNLNI